MDLTARDAAKLLGVSEDTVYEWLRDGTLPSYRVGERFRLNRVELLEWAAARKMKISPAFFQNGVSKSKNLLLAGALGRGGILFDLPCNDKATALKALCERIPLPDLANRDELHDVLIAREALCSTGIGNGVAIPHPRGPIVLGVSDPQVTLAFPLQPLEYGAIDGKPVSILFVIVSTTVRVHLSLLSHLMFALQDKDFRKLLDDRAAPEDILARLAAIEAQVAENESTREAEP